MYEELKKTRAHSQLPSCLADGVRFSCTDCGLCCSGAPGKVRVSEEEIREISEYRNQSETDFRSSETRVVKGEVLLKEKENGDCVFFVNNRCQIHEVKPRQCRTYPFWFQNVRNDRAWQKTCKECPGIGQGKWYSPEEIVEVVMDELNS
ncbi:YkgJ family cysteine cluster protein [Kiritimatiellaeota bacterium B1221]|nr:YkgJ family cysteine cluster protein [Kiritimatiellaeota bacterium B1221]